MSIHNVVHTQVRFKINLPVLNSKKHLERPCDTTTETKKPKIQKSKAFVKGPKLLDFLVFLGFFWFLGFALKKPCFFFGFLLENQKNTRFFWFFCWVSGEKPKKPCAFLDFCWKTKKTQGFFGFSAGFLVKNQKKTLFFLDFCWKTKKTMVSLRRNPKNKKKPRKTKKSKNCEVALKVLKLLDFWIFGSLSL